jgi:hypothetical protein
MDAGIGCRWIPSAARIIPGGVARLAFRPREVSGAGWLGWAPLSACARTVGPRACRYANGHLHRRRRRCLCRVLTVARRVAGLGIFPVERLVAAWSLEPGGGCSRSSCSASGVAGRLSRIRGGPGIMGNQPAALARLITQPLSHHL